MSIFNNNKFDPFGTNSLFADINKTNQQINSMNLPVQPTPQEQDFKRQRYGNMMLALSDVLKGNNPAPGVIERQALIEAQKKEAEKKAKQELLKQQQDAFIKANPEYADMIRMKQLFNITQGNNKLTKSDFVVEILEKIKNNPGYKLTNTDQRILDTISDTDPMKIMIRNRLKEMQVNNFDNQNTTQTGPVTVTTQEEFDALPSGSLFIEDGKTYRKP